MNKVNQKSLRTVSRWILAGLVSFSLLLTHAAMADPEQVGGATQDAVAVAKEAARKKQQEFSAEAVAAIKNVVQAIDLLADGKKDEAVKKLEAASGKLTVAMAADSELELVPVASDVSIFDLATTPEKVKTDLDIIEDLLDDGDVQGARVLLAEMRSEIVTETAYLPLATYPDAIKRAVSEITANESKKAEATLAMAMDSLVKERLVLPLPVVRAQGAISEAEKVQETDKDEALRDLDYAAAQLKVARRLGYFYTDTAGYRAFKDDIDDLRQALTGKSKTEQLFDEAKNSVSRLLDKFRGEKPKE